MTKSNAEEIIAILWFILACVVPYPWARGFAAVMGGVALAGAAIYAVINR